MKALQVMADRLSFTNQDELKSVLMNTVIPNGKATEAQFASFLAVANEYGLNPLTKEIYAFPSGGGIQNIVSIDGWMKIINSHPQFDGMEFDNKVSDGKVIAITCRMYRKDRGRPVTVTEYLSECVRNTPTWKQWPIRMLRHKAAIQAARYAFGFGGIMEEDEFERMEEKDVTPQPQVIEQEPEQNAFDRMIYAVEQCEKIVTLNKYKSAFAKRLESGEITEPEHESLVTLVDDKIEKLEFAGED